MDWGKFTGSTFTNMNFWDGNVVINYDDHIPGMDEVERDLNNIVADVPYVELSSERVKEEN